MILPGLIDPHVHLRTPGQSHKEDFYTGTSAALAGGYTTILDMPNNKIPITTLERLEEKIAIAKQQIVCDVGFHFGSLGDNLDEFSKVNPPAGGKVLGLKLYLNETTGNFLIGKEKLEKIFLAWTEKKSPVKSIALRSNILYAQKPRPILLHAEDKTIEEVIKIVREIRIPVHFCHISTAPDLKQIIKAKENGLPISCGVTPHHLFLTEDDVKTLGPYGKMKPPLKSKKDVAFLWKNLAAIDVVESDHAPHTKEEKEADPPPYGIPGLETTLPLLLTAVSEKRLTIDDVIRLCHTNPARIFNITQDSQTKIEVDLHRSYSIDNKYLYTKCGWSPFNEWKVKGRVVKVAIRGKTVFKDGTVISSPGSGNIVVS